MSGYRVMVLPLIVFAAAGVAAYAQSQAPAAQPPRARPRQAPPVAPAVAADAVSEDTAASAPGAPKFVAEDKWILAGYNNNEIVYQVFVTNQDTRIIRCITQIKGTYIENDGKKLSIEDRQITTVFPNQPTQVGNWMDMDQASGATYSVKCHTV